MWVHGPLGLYKSQTVSTLYVLKWCCGPFACDFEGCCRWYYLVLDEGFGFNSSLPLVRREWKNGSNGSYNCSPFLHSLLTKGKQVQVSGLGSSKSEAWGSGLRVAARVWVCGSGFSCVRLRALADGGLRIGFSARCGGVVMTRYIDYRWSMGLKACNPLTKPIYNTRLTPPSPHKHMARSVCPHNIIIKPVICDP